MGTTKFQKYMERQQEYVKSLGEKGEEAFQLIAVENFIQSMRKSGYKNTSRAIDEFIDNSYQAFATRIDIIHTKDVTKNKRGIDNIAIVDNGLGMMPEMLRAAVLWGGTDRLNDREGFGRFGFGLPSAAVSLTKEYEVYSKVKDGKWHKVVIDISEIVKGKLTQKGKAIVEKPIETDIPDFIKNYLEENNLNIEQGSIIRIVEPDALSSGMRSPEGFHRNLMEHIGVIYRNVMDTCDIYVNNIKVTPIDPLFLKPNCRFFDVSNGVIAEDAGIKEFEFQASDGKKGKVKIHSSFLPNGFQNSDDKENQRLKIMKDNHAFFIVSRAGRQIDLITKTDFPQSDDNFVLVNYDRNWVIELDFEPSLDEEFGITVNKQQATISERMWEKLASEDLPLIIKGLRKKFKESKVKSDADNNQNGDKLSEKIMKNSDEQGIIPKPIDQTIEKAEEAQKKIKDEAEEIAKKLKKPSEEIEKELSEKYSEKSYEVVYDEAKGGDIYWIEQYGPKVILHINIKHRFYSDVYMHIKDNRIKTGIELLLFVMGTAELKANGSKEIFYQTEKVNWSRDLEALLAVLDKTDSLDEKNEADDEQ